jgi:hypothetical protein
MTVTLLADMHYARRTAEVMAARDSLGRIVAHGPPWNSGLTDYDYTVSPYERYDPSTNTWTVLANTNQLVDIYGWMLDSSDRFYYAGGQVLVNSSTFYHGTGHAEYYDPVGNAWHYLASLPTGETRYQSYYWPGASGELYLAGGQADGALGSHPAQDGPPNATDWNSTSGLYGNVLKFSGGPSGTWTKLSTSTVLNQFNQNHAPLVDSSGRAYFLGSQNGGTTTQRYNTATDTWTSLAAFPWQTRAFAAVMVSDVIYIAGGTRPATAGRAYKYDTASDTWTRLADLPVALQFNYVDQLLYHPVTNAIYMWGGYDGTNYVATIYKYDIATDTWSNTGDALSVGRDGAATAFDGTGWYLIGGSRTGTFQPSKTLEYFVPAGVVAAPSRRFGFAAVIG